MSQVVRKHPFIGQFLEILHKDLERELPDEDFETSMLERAWEIVAEKVRHIRKAVL